MSRLWRTDCHYRNQVHQLPSHDAGRIYTRVIFDLSGDQLTFVRAFLRVRGNLSEMEKVLGVSYPTIRNKLEEINQALDRAEQAPDPIPLPNSERNAILQMVANGELTSAEALERLKGLS